MSRENEILEWLHQMLIDKGCNIIVDINETIIFDDPDGRTWRVKLEFKSNPAQSDPKA